jgi:integrase
VLSQQNSELHRRIENMPKVHKFLFSKTRGAVNTAIGYKTSLAYFQQFLTTNYNDLTLETIIEPLISRKIDVYDLLDCFVSYLQNIKLNRSSIHQYLVGIRAYLGYNDIDIVNSKFKRRVTMPKNIQEEEQALDQDDIRNILLKCNNRRLKVYILILASSGLRAIEACAIRLRDLDFQSNPTKLHVRGEYTKTKVSRDIFISDEASKYLKDWIEYTFKIDVDRIKNINDPMSEYLVFKVHKNTVSSNTHAIYQKLVSQFHIVLRSAGLGDRKESMKRGRITFHSFRRFLKTTISDSEAGSDYSEWFLGHRKNAYYSSKQTVRAEIYATKVMKYLTFLDYSTLEAAGKNFDARINELEHEKQIMSQKYEQQIQELREETDDKLNQVIMMIQKNPKLARLKREVLKTRPLKRK